MKPQDKSKIISFSLVAAVFGILLMTAAMAGCTETDRQQDGQVVVAVTILPEQEFVERVGGDHVRVVLLVPPGADPHTKGGYVCRGGIGGRVRARLEG